MKYPFFNLLLLFPLLTQAQGNVAYQSVSVERISFTKAVLTGKVFSVRKPKEAEATYALTTDLSTIRRPSPPPIEYLLKIENQRNSYSDLLTECQNSFKTPTEASSFFSKMGWDYLAEGNRKEARKRFDWAYLLDGNNVDAFWGLGVMTFQEDRLHESTLFMERGIEVGKTVNVTLMVDLATVYIKLFTTTEQQPKYLARAFELAEKAIELQPTYVNAYMQKGLAELMSGKVSNAWITFHKGYEIAPKETDMHLLANLLAHEPDPKGIFK